MKLKFDSNLTYQQDAIRSITDLFEGLPSSQDEEAITISSDEMLGEVFNELGVGNPSLLATDQLLANLHSVQTRNNIPKSVKLIDAGGRMSFQTSPWKWRPGLERHTSTCAPSSN